MDIPTRQHVLLGAFKRRSRLLGFTHERLPLLPEGCCCQQGFFCFVFTLSLNSQSDGRHVGCVWGTGRSCERTECRAPAQTVGQEGRPDGAKDGDGQREETPGDNWTCSIQKEIPGMQNRSGERDREVDSACFHPENRRSLLLLLGVSYSPVNEFYDRHIPDLFSCKYIPSSIPFFACELKAVGPYKRGFICGDPSITYPYLHNEAIPDELLIAGGIFITGFAELGSFLFGCCIGQSLTNMAKLSVGRLRPYFLSVCGITYASLNCTPGTYVATVTCRNPDHRLEEEAR
ncbi:hypothetical protein XENOCAPTIV_013023 [Xenoophorus captivus]|uniref:Uncharacterized protein n=1 Tax=Xenoophorus captivus TaxID=1517983 RepID=A0ABV0R4R4_9TELE